MSTRDEAAAAADEAASEDLELARIGDDKLDQSAGDLLRVLLIVAARLGRIEARLASLDDIVDERIPGDLGG